MNDIFPPITINGTAVNPKDYIEKGTGLVRFWAVIVAILFTLIAILVSYGLVLLFWIAYPLIGWFLHRKAAAMIHGSGVHINQQQIPEIHRCVETFKARLGLNKQIDVYIVEDNIINAFAVRIGKKNMVLLTDDLINNCLSSGCPQSLSFVIAHELAHIALNHTGLFQSWMSQHLKLLGRKNEYSADAVAQALVGSSEVAFQGILVLTVGSRMLPFIDRESLVRQVKEVQQNTYSKKCEKNMTHPLLLNRLARFIQ